MDPFSFLIISGISAAAGGLFNMMGDAQRAEEQQKALRRQKEDARKAYEYGKAASDAKFGIERGEALTSLGVQQGRLREALGLGIGQMNTGLLGQAMGIQDAQIGTAGSIGASLASEGMSGTRGNSANGIARAYEQASLDRGADLQGRENSNSLASIMAQANNAQQDLRREAAGWGADGWRTATKDVQDEYNKNIADLGQANFDWQIGNAGYTGYDAAFGFMQGAYGGWNFGTGLYDSWKSSKGSAAPTFKKLG